jgi:hypothetical protein
LERLNAHFFARNRSTVSSAHGAGLKLGRTLRSASDIASLDIHVKEVRVSFSGAAFLLDSEGNTCPELTFSLSVFRFLVLMPHGLAFESAGNLYVAMTGPFLLDGFTLNGVGSVFAGFNGSAGDINSGEAANYPGPTLGSVSQVPRPSPLSPAIVMFGAIGIGRLSGVLKRRLMSR